MIWGMTFLIIACFVIFLRESPENLKTKAKKGPMGGFRAAGFTNVQLL